MKSIIAKTQENVEFVVTVDSVTDKFVNVHVNGIASVKNHYGSALPGFYKEHAHFNLPADFDNIFETIKRGITYHFHWTKESQFEIREWIMNILENSYF